MGRIYGVKIKNKEINPKTKLPWTLSDVPRLFRSAVEEWLADNP